MPVWNTLRTILHTIWHAHPHPNITRRPRRTAILMWKRDTGKNNAYLCKRKQAGGLQFSRDPMNLTNPQARVGFVCVP